MKFAIEVEHLVKSYGDFTAVSDVSFSVRPGEVFCLLGPNGAGKTTTTEVLEGYRRRSAGHVSVLGFDPGEGARSFRERIGIVLQECGVQADLTVAEVLDMYGRYYPKRLATSDVIELVELDAKATDRVSRLSGGQRRRLDVGLALIGDPELIFLDEPTTGFDPAARRHSWSTIRSLCSLGKTVLLTTHFMDEAQALADRIAVVAGGRIVAEGTPDDLGGRNRARTTVEATLPAHLDAALPNFGPADVTVDGDRIRIVAEDGIAITHRLTTWALDNRVELTGFTVTQPSLEDIYLALTNDITDTRIPALTKENHR